MILFRILGILAALILLLCLLRVGIHVVYEQEHLTVDVKIGWFRIRVFPAKEKKKRTIESAKKKEKPKKESNQHKKPTFAEIKDAAQTLWPAVKKALRKTGKGVRIHPMTLRVTVGGQTDPAKAAQLYGELQAALWSGMPVLEQLLVIPDPRIHIGINFDESKWEYAGKIGISARVGTLLGIGLTLAIPALKWYLRFQKKTETQSQVTAENKAA